MPVLPFLAMLDLSPRFRIVESTLDEASRSVSIALSQHLKKCLDQYLYVKPKAPIIDIPQIQLHALGDVLDRRCCAPRPVALGPPRHAWLNVMAKGVVA